MCKCTPFFCSSLCSLKFKRLNVMMDDLRPFHVTKERAAASCLTEIKALNHIFNFFL